MNAQAAGGGLYWLASYPKSGNTWIRAFIANLTNGKDEAVDINELHTGEIASCYSWVEDALGFEISELSQDEIDYLRPQSYRWMAAQMREAEYHKIHDAYTYLPDGQPLIPADATRGALYIVRNPLDVAISYAHHNNSGIDTAIRNMGDAAHCFCGHKKKMHNQLRQKLLSWSGHVESWLDAPGLNRMVVRYEDMQAQPLETFTRIARFLGLPRDEPAILGAMENSKMEKLQKQEAEKGFREKMPFAKSFFRKGIVGDWVGTLTEEQVSRVVDDHREVMKRLGYLDASGKPAEQIMALETAGLETVRP